MSDNIFHIVGTVSIMSKNNIGNISKNVKNVCWSNDLDLLRTERYS